MKKLIAFLLAFTLLLCLSACTDSDDNDDTKIQTTSKRNVVITKDEVAKLVKNGNITGANLALGTKKDEVEDYYMNIVGTTAAEQTAAKTNKKGKVVKPKPTTEPTMVTAIGPNGEYYEYKKGDSLSSIWYNGEKYYFLNENLDAGVAIIVCNEKAFGFNIGNCPSIDVETSLGKPDIKDTPDATQLFFCLGSVQNAVRYTYNFGSKRLDFIFSNDNLLVVTLTETNVYKGFSKGADVTATAKATQETTVPTYTKVEQ